MSSERQAPAKGVLALACIALILAVGIAMITEVPDLTPLLVKQEPTTVTTDADFGKININTANKEQLMLLSGIGEVMAQRLFDYREQNGSFTCVEDLLNVQGIGEAKLEEIRNQIVF